MEGSVLTAGGTIRVRPVDGGGNETQQTAPASGVLLVRGLENGNYEAVDELGNKRVFTVTQGPGEEVVLEDFGPAADEPQGGVQLDPLHGTDALAVADESHEIQGGLPAMTVEGASLVRGGSDQPSATTPAAQEDGPPAEATVEPEPDQAPEVVPVPEASVAESDPVTGEQTRVDLEAWNLSTAHLAAVLDNDTGEFPQAGQIDVGSAVDELKQRAEGGDAAAQTALEKHGLADVPRSEEAAAADQAEPPSPANPAEVAALEQPEAGSDVPPADDPEHEPAQPDVDPGAQA